MLTQAELDALGEDIQKNNARREDVFRRINAGELTDPTEEWVEVEKLELDIARRIRLSRRG